MGKFLIVNADDFGLQEEVNAAIVEAHRNGIVTSASLLANGETFEHAVTLAMRNPELGVGAHLSLTRGPSLKGGPLLDPLELPSLVRADGLFPQNPVTLTARAVAGVVSASQVERELRAQLEKIKSSGIRISHIDSHQHIHLAPLVFRIVVELAREFEVGWLRLPLSCGSTTGDAVGLRAWLKAGALERLAARHTSALADAGLRTADRYLGLELAGRLSEDALERMVSNLPDGITELTCHPGADDARLRRNHPWGYRWQQELSALCSSRLRDVIQRRGIKLVAYSEL